MHTLELSARMGDPPGRPCDSAVENGHCFTKCVLMTRVMLFLLLFFSICKSAPADSFDHNAGTVKLGCGACHTIAPGEAGPSAGRTRLEASGFTAGNSWCRSCHDLKEGTSHPTGISASQSCGLPLGTAATIDCLTCHSPHTPPTASQPWLAKSLDVLISGGHRTRLLIEPNPGGELCRRCHVSGKPGEEAAPMHETRSFQARAYAGSAACESCHPDIYASWKITLHARMVRLPSQVKGFDTIASAGFEWPREKIKYVLGEHYVQRFVAEASGTLVMLPRIYDLRAEKWLGVRDYGWRKRDWIKQCGGCHVTGFTSDGDRFVEPGVGCENCHGPALDHVRTTSPAFVTNPAKLTPERREMICMSCHTSGMDESGQYAFPVGFRPGDDLGKFFSGLTPKPGQDGKTFFGDETPADRVRQWEFLKSRLFLAKGLTCDYCQNFRNVSTANNSEYMTHDQYCVTCHFVTVADTAPAKSPRNTCGSGCTQCHLPAKTASGTYSIHDHKFRF
ncbi:MAG: hypothetical protein HQM09_16965 [Candidatus Riflebacteria bacterium]|nr:hypothetical protein [Candidatus Riflebacteria bacterium]